MRPTTLSAHRGLAATTVVIGSASLALAGAPASADDRVHDPDRLRVVVAPPARVAATNGAPATYTIRAGDTISAVAARFGLRTVDVLAWNGLGWSTVIHPGQVIVLAAPAAAAAPDPAPAPAAAPVTETTHTVARGDTLWEIARAAGIPLASLLAANGLIDGSIIYPGQTLIVPLTAPPTPSPSPAPAPAAVSAPAELDAEQAANARIVIEVGRSLGVSDRGIAIALSTAMVESWLRNLDWGDRDSRGLFQQRPSTGWGTEAEVGDPYRAAAAFFGGPTDPNGTRTQGLLDIPGWESMEFGAAAQAVQRSAHPDRYGPWEQSAYAWLAALG